MRGRLHREHGFTGMGNVSDFFMLPPGSPGEERERSLDKGQKGKEFLTGLGSGGIRDPGKRVEVASQTSRSQFSRTWRGQHSPGLCLRSGEVGPGASPRSGLPPRPPLVLREG